MPAKNMVIERKGPQMAACYAPERASSPISFNPRAFPVELETLAVRPTYNKVEDRVERYA
jgi:hypothetical protein